MNVPEVIAEASLLPDFHDRIDQLEVVMRRYPDYLLDIPPVHRFAGGVYTREITIPAGVLITGKIHKYQHLVMISNGDVTVWSEHTGVMRVQGPYVFISEPGARRVIFAHKETVWTTIHSTPSTAVEEVESEIFIPHEPNPSDTTIGEEIFARMVYQTMQEQGLLES